MKLVLVILILMAVPFAAHADFGMDLQTAALLCTGTGLKDSASIISLKLSPSEGAQTGSAIYKIDREKPVRLSLAAIALRSEGSILLQTYGKYAPGQDDYLNLMIGGDDADRLAEDLEKEEDLRPVYKFEGFISFNRETRFKVSCVGSFVK